MKTAGLFQLTPYQAVLVFVGVVVVSLLILPEDAFSQDRTPQRENAWFVNALRLRGSAIHECWIRFGTRRAMNLFPGAIGTRLTSTWHCRSVSRKRSVVRSLSLR